MKKQAQSMSENVNLYIPKLQDPVSSGNLVPPKMNICKGQTVLVYSGAQVWNSLPRWCTLRELRTQALFENVSALSFHFSLNLVGSGR